MSTTRLVTVDDAPELAALLTTNRAFLAPWEPIRPDTYFSVAAQRADIQAALDGHARETGVPRVILDRSGRIVGRITLSGVVRGPFQSADLGYWVGAADNGRGLATSAVHEMKRVAFDELRLHRIQAATLPHNVGSQRVLARNGFAPIGMAPAYLHIAGQWQDHNLYQVVTTAVTDLGGPERPTHGYSPPPRTG